VNCNEVVPFRGIALGLKTLAIAGGATMASCAVLLVAPVPPPVEVIALVVLFLVPVLVPVTLTEKGEDGTRCWEMPSTSRPIEVMALLAAVRRDRAATAGTGNARCGRHDHARRQVVDEGHTAQRTRGVRIGDRKLKVLLPFNATLVGVKPLLIVGGDTTVMLALETPLMPPSVEVTATLLVAGPGVVPVTLTENVHEDPPPAMPSAFPPDKLMEPLPPVAVIAPLPQLPVKLGGCGYDQTARKRVRKCPHRSTLRWYSDSG